MIDLIYKSLVLELTCSWEIEKGGGIYDAFEI